MSKRFGRNQRRHAREALASQVVQTNKLRDLAQDRLEQFHQESNRNQDMREFFRRVAQRVGQEAYIAMGTKLIIKNENSSSTQLMAPEPIEFSFDPHSPIEDMKLMVETVRHLEVKVVQDAFRREILCEAYIMGESAGYALSETLIRRVPKEELAHILTRTIAPELARHLAKALKERT